MTSVFPVGVRLLLRWEAVDLRGTSVPVVVLVNSGWYVSVLGRSVQCGLSVQQLELA